MPFSRTMHAYYSLGRDPLPGRICPSGSLKVARAATSPRLMHRYFASRVSPYWYWEYGFGATFLFYCYSSEVPRPETSMPLPYRLLLCLPLHGHSYLWVSGVALPNCRHFLVRTQSTPEAWPSPFSSHCAPDGSHQVLTLVNARQKVKIKKQKNKILRTQKMRQFFGLRCELKKKEKNLQ